MNAYKSVSHKRIDEFNQLGEWLPHTMKSRALGGECKNAALEKGGGGKIK